MTLNKLCQELEQLDHLASGSDSVTLESIRDCLHRPLTFLSPLLIKHTAWKRHVWLLLNTLLPQWALQLTLEDRQALVATLIGPGTPSVLMAQLSLPLLLECIHNPSTALNVLDLYSVLLKSFVSGTMVATYLHNLSDPLDRSTLCSLVCSIPARLSNAYGLLQDDGANNVWYSDRVFYTMLTQHIALEIRITHDGTAIDVAAELIGKMVRQGHQDLCIATLIPIAVESTESHQVWNSLWAGCEKVAPMDKVYGAILRYINTHTEPLRQTDLPPSAIRYAIQAMASRLSPVLFANSRGRLDDFMAYTLKDTSRMKQVNVIVLRVVVAIAVHAAGLEPLNPTTDDYEWKLSVDASDMISRFLYDVVDTWTDPVLIKQASDGEKQYITTALLILFGYANKAMMQDIQRSTGLVMGITTWFTSADESTAKLAMIVAETMSVRTINQDEAILDFKIPFDKRLQELKQLGMIADGLTRVNEDSSLVLAQDALISVDDDDLLNETDQDLDPDALMVPDDEDEEDSDLEPYPMEEESDGEGAEGADPKKKKARAPVYVSELVDYLKDQEDPEKLEIGLKAAEGIIRQKAGVGSEVAEWSIVLGKRLIYFPETYEIDNYRRLQQLALVALMAACPEKITSFIMEQFFSKDTSIGQKNMILSAISMVALELSGWDSYSKGTDDKGIDMGQLDLALPSVSDTTKSGQLTFSSSRAQADIKRQKGIIRNRLSGLAGPIFFFPLVIGWWEQSQLRLRWMTQDPMMVERFVMTLNVIMQCASNTPDKKKIVKEYFDYCASLRYVPKLSTRILRALLLGINTIIHICYKEQGYLLIENFTLEISESQQWLEDVLETHQQDTELQSLILKLLVSIGQLAKMESYQP